MTTENKFGKVSRLEIRSECKDGETILRDVAFTAPYKVMTPFKKANGGISVMPLCASAGIMNGDRQEFVYHVGEGSNLEMLSQSFEKIHKMDEGGFAERKIEAVVEKNSVFYYYPQPVIPFAESAFDSVMDIQLEDESAKLFLVEVIACGRSAREEQFQYRRFATKTEIRRGGKLIYRDNTRFEPATMPMTELGMYEGYTHVGNIFMTVTDEEVRRKLKDNIWSVLNGENLVGSQSGIAIENDESIHIDMIDGGVTELAYGDLAIRVFANRAQVIQDFADKVKEIFG